MSDLIAVLNELTERPDLYDRASAELDLPVDVLQHFIDGNCF